MNPHAYYFIDYWTSAYLFYKGEGKSNYEKYSKIAFCSNQWVSGKRIGSRMPCRIEYTSRCITGTCPSIVCGPEWDAAGA